MAWQPDEGWLPMDKMGGGRMLLQQAFDFLEFEQGFDWGQPVNVHVFQ